MRRLQPRWAFLLPWLLLPLLLRAETVEITLALPYDEAGFEYSGLTWYKDRLILLPQYPDDKLFSVREQSLLEAIASKTPLLPEPLPFDDTAIRASVEGYEGYEAIAFDGNEVYALIECSGVFGGMWGYLVTGTVDASGITMRRLLRLETPVSIRNYAFESVAVSQNSVYVFYEASGMMKAPYALKIDKALKSVERLPLSRIDFRVTDLSAFEGNRLWAVNTFWPGDREKLGTDRTTALAQLIELEVSERGIEATGNTVPILDGGVSFNYEGLARFGDRGFIVITDTYPRTRMDFLPYNDNP